MLSWSTESLIADGRGLSETAEGVTLEVMGEGDSMGPLNPEMKRLAVPSLVRSPTAPPAVRLTQLLRPGWRLWGPLPG